MALTIDELDIQIEAESTKATNAIDTLIGRLETLSGKLNILGSAGKGAGNGLKSTADGATKASNAVDKHKNSVDKATKSTEKFTDKLAKKISKFHTLYGAFKSAAGVMAGWFNESNEYIETLNLFNVTMGDGRDAAYEFAESVQNLIGIDMSEWMQYQGVFKNLTSGFGVATKEANIMSQNLTQLSYDMASFFNTDVETAFDKLSSAMSGQVKGLREFGIDTTVASLQEYALAKGIDTKVRSMTQAEKSMLRYNYIMEKSIIMQGDMARTLVTPANALRVLEAQLNRMKRAFGNIISVLVTQFIPYVQVMVEVVTEAANSLANFFGFELPKIDYSGLEENLAGTFEDAEDSADGVSDAVKKIKKQLMGFDELNIISNPDTDSGTSGSDAGAGSLNGMQPFEYDFLAGLDTSGLDEAKEKLKDILTWVETIAAGFAAWKISKGIIAGLEFIQKLKGKTFNFGFNIVGGIAFLADLDKLRKYIEDINKNGADFSNVAGVISEFAGLIGDAFIILGKVQTGAALKVIQGIGEIVSGISDIAQNGVNWDNATDVVRGISNLGIAIGLFTKNIQLTGAFLALQGLTAVINEIATNWEAIKNGDWSGVDKVTLIIGAIELIGGVITALGVLSKIKGAVDTTQAAPAAQEVATATETINTSTSTLTAKLGSLAKNLGLGLVILAEVAAAALLFAGAIWGLGEILTQVANAWQPVIDNGDTVAIAIGVGTGLLAGIGVATVALGKLGKGLVADIAIGTAMLVLLGAGAALFITEIWGIGVGLQKIGEAWQPVLDNGETVASGIGLGTALLVGVGVVTAALGAATVASAGALPLAIGLGTAILVELAAAFVLFIESLVVVARQLYDNLSPELDELNSKLPGLSTDMENFTDFMSHFTWQVVVFSADSVIAGIATTVEKIIGFFTADPIQSMSDNVAKQNRQFDSLIRNLEDAIPDVERAIELVDEYNDVMARFEQASDASKPKIVTFLSDVLTGTWDNIKNVINKILGGIELMVNGVIKGLNWMIDSLNELSFDVPDWVPVIGGETFGFDISNISTVSIPRLAEGGIVDEGQMFIAREAGPELVGNIGRKTAVANNDQIISGIESGVYRAMVAANAHGNGGTQTIHIITEIDGDVVGEKVIQYHNGKVIQTGASPLLV